MIKPELIAIVGKSSSGKTTLSNILNNNLEKYNIWISDTTRPLRKNEVNGKDYYFITEDEFIDNLSYDRYFEATNFRNWFYGHNKKYLTHRNIAIFDPSGLKNLIKKHSEDFNTITIYYLKAGPIERLKRSFKRESKWHFEYLRRLFVDFVDFIGLEKWIQKNLPSNAFFDIIDNEKLGKILES